MKLELTEDECNLITAALYEQERGVFFAKQYIQACIELQANIEAQWCAQANQEELI